MKYLIQAILQILGVLAMGGGIFGLAICGVMIFHGHWGIALGGFIMSVLSFMSVDWLAELSVGDCLL